MVIRLNILIFLACVCASLDDNHEWELAVATEGQVQMFNRNGSLVGYISQQFKDLKALAYDIVRHQLIIADADGNNDDKIYRLLLTGKNKADTVTPTLPDYVKDVAINPLSNEIYWIDILNKRILWMSLNDVSKTVNTLFQFNNSKPAGLAIDSCRRKIYWTNANYPESTIERSNLDGTEREIIVSSNIFVPSGINIDQGTKTLYWADKGEGIYFRIESINLDGTNRKIVLQDRHQKPNRLVVTEDMVYWTDLANDALWGIKKNVESPEPQKLREFNAPPRGLVAKSKDIINSLECADVLNAFKQKNSSADIFEVARDSTECLNSGELTPHGCKCSRGFVGSKCEINLCYNFCFNGNCYFSSEGYPQCKCPLGFTGSRCEYEMCTNYCLNGGECHPTLNGSLFEPTCNCGPHFSGQRCERVNDIEMLCTLICEENTHNVIVIDDSETKCRCANEIRNDKFVYKKINATAESLFTSSLESQFAEKIKDPVIMASWSLNMLLFCTILALCVIICRLRLKRPRIKKRIIVNKNITPLTYRPNQSTEQCEITIENCCNMNICETPCFEPPNLGCQYKKSEEKKTLLASMENGEDIY